jgi:hypothetical protein
LHGRAIWLKEDQQKVLNETLDELISGLGKLAAIRLLEANKTNGGARIHALRGRRIASLRIVSFVESEFPLEISLLLLEDGLNLYAIKRLEPCKAPKTFAAML